MIRNFLQRPTVRPALQSGVGVGLAIAFGHLVSGNRWYWAVIAAFIIGVGVQSRGEAVVKGLQRSAGTLAGIAAGIGIATAISGHTDVALGLVLVCVALAYYSFQSAYGIMIFFITIMVALLYGMLGLFRPQLLVLRLEETLIGVATGILATTLLLPIRENDVFHDAADGFLDALCDLMAKAPANNGDALHDATARLVSSLQTLRQSLGALKRGWVPLVPNEYRDALRTAMRCAYWARELVESGTSSPEQLAPAVDRIKRIRARLEPQRVAERHKDDRSVAQELPEDVAALLEALDRLDSSLGRLDLGKAGAARKAGMQVSRNE